MTVSINGTSGLIFNDASTQNTAATGFGFKNRIINGAMVIDQRNAGASATPADGAYTLDRWKTFVSQASKLTIQQNAGSVTPPVGYSKYLGITVGASANVTVGASDYFAVLQVIEGQNVADMAWGTASAATITISFWVRSSLTGTFGGAFRNGTGNRSYPFTYTISAANTWEQKSITIAGDTSGTWVTTNAAGAFLEFGLGAGSTYSGTAGAWAGASYESATGAVKLIETNSATFYITGVQLEKGSTATSFDYRPIGTELALCMRYYETSNISGNLEWLVGAYANNTEIDFSYVYQVPKRAAPTVAIASSNWSVYADSAFRTTSSPSVNTTGINNAGLYVITSGTTLSGKAGQVRNTAANAITISSEL